MQASAQAAEVSLARLIASGKLQRLPCGFGQTTQTHKHLFLRSFYPVFPSPPPSKMLDALNLDITHYDLVKMGSSGPDIVIAPSIQKHFTRVRPRPSCWPLALPPPGWLARYGSREDH